MSFVSYNVHGEVLNDHDDNRRTPKQNLINHLDKIKPKHILILRNFDLAMELAKRYPAMTVHIRYWSNEGVLNKDGSYAITPKTWLDNVKKDWIKANELYGVRNVSFYTTNEPRQLDKIAQWHYDLMTLNLTQGYRLPLTVVNFGHYEEYEIPHFKQVFQLLADYPSLYILGTHEYFSAVPSSGMPELDINKKPFVPIPYDKWDRRENATRFHVGRHQFILKYCDDNQIARPRMVITEFGADRLDEQGNWFGQWLNTLKMTPPYLNIRGWRTLKNQWLEWFVGWAIEQTYFMMIQYLIVRIYLSKYLDKDRNIEGVFLFSWWNSGILGTAEDWTQFRVDNAEQFQKYVEDFANGVRLGLEKDVIEENPPNENPIPNEDLKDIYEILDRLTELTTTISNNQVNLNDRLRIVENKLDVTEDVIHSIIINGVNNIEIMQHVLEDFATNLNNLRGKI